MAREKKAKAEKVIDENKVDEILSDLEVSDQEPDPKSDSISDPVEGELKASYKKEKKEKKLKQHNRFSKFKQEQK